MAPQDSVLVSFLFLIYINYLQNNTSIDILKFADDIILYKLLKKNYMTFQTLIKNLKSIRFANGKLVQVHAIVKYVYKIDLLNLRN